MAIDRPPAQNRDLGNDPGPDIGSLIESAHRSAQMGELDAAQAAYEQALAADPELQEAWLGLAGLTPDPMFARALYERILQKWPDCDLARTAMAHLDAEGGLRHAAVDAELVITDPLDAAARAGAPLYRNAHGDMTEASPRVETGVALAHTPNPPTALRRLTTTRALPAWLRTVGALAALCMLVAAVVAGGTAWHQARRETQTDARASVPTAVAPGEPTTAQGDIVASSGVTRLDGLSSQVRRHLVMLPPPRTLMLDLAEGTLTASEFGQVVRTIPVGALRAVDAGSAGCQDATPSQARVAMAGAPWRTSSNVCGTGAPYLYAIDLARVDARWLGEWLGPQGLGAGQFTSVGERVLISLH